MHGGNISVQTSRVARLAVPHRKESREGQLVEGDCVGGRNRWEGAIRVKFRETPVSTAVLCVNPDLSQ